MSGRLKATRIFFSSLAMSCGLVHNSIKAPIVANEVRAHVFAFMTLDVGASLYRVASRLSLGILFFWY